MKDYLTIFSSLIILSSYIKALPFQFIELTDDNYNKELTFHDALVIFYNEWISDSRDKSIEVLREIKKVIELKGGNNSFNDSQLLYCISSQKQYLLLNKYKIVSPYPKIMFIQNNTIAHLFQQQYNIKESFDINLISNWIISKKLKEIPSITSITQLNYYKTIHDVFICIIGDNRFLQTYFKYKLLDTFTSLSFFHIKDLSIIQQIEHLLPKYHDLDNKIIIFKQFDERIKVIADTTFSGFLSIEDFEKMIKVYAYPFITPYTSEEYIELITHKQNFTLILLPQENPENKNGLLMLNKTIIENGQEIREETKFLQANYDQLYHTAIMNDFNLNNNEQPVILVFKYSLIDNMYYKFKEEVNLNKPNNFNDFFDKYKYDRLKRYMRSESDIQLKDENNNVYRLIGRNYNDIVYLKNKDAYVAILFIRENCFNCNEMESNFKELAKEMINEETMIFCIIDGFKNEIDNVNIKEYPSLLLYKPE